MKRKIEIGDVFEIETVIGKAYLQYIYKDDTLGELIRILPGVYNDIPEYFNELIKSEEEYMIFFPLAAAFKKKIVRYVSSYPNNKFAIPEFMRSDHYIQGKFIGWHIVDINTWNRKLVKELNENQRKLSPFEVWNDTMLIEKITNNWKLSDWV